jgi:site-specific recombinase XerD
MKKQRGVFEKIPGSGVWWIQYFDADGRRRREKIGPKKSAISLVEQRRTDARLGVKMPENLRAKSPLFSELAAHALDYGRANKRSFYADDQRMKVLVDQFGNRTADDITRGDIQKWLDSNSAKWSLATRNRYLALLKLTFRLAEERELIKKNPARLVHQRKEDNGRVRYLSDAEETKLREVVQTSYGEHLAEVEIALMTGMRQGEQFGLTWEKVDLGAGTLRLEVTKNGKGRFVRLNSRALTIMRAMHQQSIGTGRVFLINKKPRWFVDAVREAGITDFTWHDLRHTFASRLVMAGVDIRTVQELMGHKSIIMTMRYSHLSPQHRAAALEKLCEATATVTATSGQAPSVVVAPVVQ